MTNLKKRRRIRHLQFVIHAITRSYVSVACLIHSPQLSVINIFWPLITGH
jgi:hypothetical protein